MIVVLSLALLLPGQKPDDPYAKKRAKMVEEQMKLRGIADARVLEAMGTVPRHLFVPERYRAQAYDDHPLPIGHDQTISQPYIVAAMTELVQPKPTDRILEVGTGSGYAAAVLSRLVHHVYTIEIIPALGKTAKKVLEANGYDNVTVIIGDGYRGLPERAPFDGIIVTAAPKEVPAPLLAQLKVGGRLVIPVGGWNQTLKVYTKTEKGFDVRTVFGVRFVPMTGEAERKR